MTGSTTSGERDRRCHQEGSGFNPIGNDRMLLQPLSCSTSSTVITDHPLHYPSPIMLSRLAGPHFGFLSSVLTGGDAVCQNRCHQDGFRGADAGAVEHDLSAGLAFSLPGTDAVTIPCSTLTTAPSAFNRGCVQRQVAPRSGNPQKGNPGVPGVPAGARC